jgi:Holliday junction resolvase YEN1
MEHLGIPWHKAPGEAEAECAEVQKLGVVDAV